MRYVIRSNSELASTRPWSRATVNNVMDRGRAVLVRSLFSLVDVQRLPPQVEQSLLGVFMEPGRK